MASGILISAGQNWVIDAIKTDIDASGGLYVGLMSNATQTAEGAQLPYASGITEITDSAGGPVACSGYARQLCATWTKTGGVDPYLTGSTVTFEASGTWLNVYGYFVSQTVSGNDALWTEVFPADKGGTKYSGDKILITPKYEQKYESEA